MRSLKVSMLSVLVCSLIAAGTARTAAAAGPEGDSKAADPKAAAPGGESARPAEKPPEPAARPAEKPPEPAGPLPGATDTKPPKPARAKPPVVYGVGANYQFLIMPQFFLRAFLRAARSSSHNLYRHAFGAHFVRRKASLDIIVRLMWGRFMTKDDDGNWLGRGHDWDELDYTEFHNLDFLWADVTFIYHWKITKGLFFGLGGGIGLGVVFGKVFTTESYINGDPATPCDQSNYSNCSVCHPAGASCTSSRCDRSSIQSNPNREKSKDVPPVLPALNGVLSLRYDIWRHTSVRLTTGIFLPGFYMLDLSLEWVF